MSPDFNSVSAFRSTRWSIVLNASDPSAAGARSAMEELIRIYWYPLYAFVRRRGYREHEAMDLTQEFFLQVLEQSSFQSASPEKGRFRAFLIASMKNFLHNDRRRGRTQKRGGLLKAFSIDTQEFERRFSHRLATDCDAEKNFDRDWAEAMLQSAIDRLRRDYEMAGRDELFTVLHPFLVADTDRLPLTEIASKLDMGLSAVKMSIHRMRKQFAARVREQVAATLLSPEDVEDELRRIVSVLRS